MDHERWMRHACHIGGQWVGADSGAVIAVTNPATGETLGTVPDCGAAETARAIGAAAQALPLWRALTARERSDRMLALHDAILDNRDALASLLTREMGKPLAEAQAEVTSGAAFFRWYAEEGRRIYGETIPSPWPDTRILVTREPVGVVGAITPWNFPHSMIARKLSAALAAGCTMVIKPANETPYSGLALGALAEEAGLPAGCVNVITGTPAPIADEMCANPLLRKISFTGSTAVGKSLAARALAHMKRISMELGGNAPFIVFDDADLDAAIAGALASKFRNSGQTCICANRLYVQAGIHDAFAEKLAQALATLDVGNGLNPGVQQGPLISAKAVAKVEAHIADALGKGARLLAGGERHALGGLFFQPTLLAGVTGAMAVAREETFGPLAPLFRFETEAEVIAAANATEYGLASYVFTRDLGRAMRMMEALEYGMVGINSGMISTEVAPFGGVKQSGMGREGSRHGLEDYMNLKYALLGGLKG